MRKREIQTITLKLSELKEYDAVKQERAALRAQTQDKPAESTSSQQPPITRVGHKTKQEIMDRIGLTDD